MNSVVLRLCEAVRDEGGRAMLVGGSVRDRLLGIESKDIDVEVYGLEPARLRRLLEPIGQVNTVGEHFSVYKVVSYPARSGPVAELQTLSVQSGLEQRFEIDVSIPRRESKSGRGHRAFVIEGDPSMSFEEAARRRDFTINAILLDPLTDEIIDPFGGRADLKHRIVRAVAADTFVEDSLRVLRAIQLAARFEMSIEAQTIALCRTIELSDLPRERIWGELEKWLNLAQHPSIGLDAAFELGVFDKLFPELHTLISRPLVLTHTKLALDEAVKLVRDLPKPKRVAVMLAVLFHGVRETQTTVKSSVNAACVEHKNVVRDAIRSLLDRVGLFGIGGYDVRSQVLALISEHSKPGEFYRGRDTNSAGDIRRLAQRVDPDLLFRVAKACAQGRGSAASSVAEDWFIETARALGVEHGPPDPLLQGRHLLEAGFEPGPEMGKLLRRVYELQLDGKVTNLEEALAAALRVDPAPPKLFR